MPLVPALARAIIATLFVLAALAAFWDFRHKRIPNWLTLPGVIAGFALNGVLYGLEGLERAGLGMLIGMGIYFVLFALHAFGAGDAKFMAAVGSLVGWRWWIHIFIAAVIIGAISGLFLAWRAGRLRRTFSNIAYILSEIAHGRPPHVRREDVDVRSEKGLRNVHGVAIAAGIFIVVGRYLWQS